MSRRCAPVFWPLLLLMSWTARGQHIVGAQAGIIQYIKENMFLDDIRLVKAHGELLEVSAGRHLWTSRGRVEMLLAPNIFVRLGEDSSPLMNQNLLNDTRIVLERGSA
jgi:hypothetical protein